MADKKTSPATFRPRGPLAPRVEQLKQLSVNQSDLFNELLLKHLPEIDAAIEKKRNELKKLLRMAA